MIPQKRKLESLKMKEKKKSMVRITTVNLQPRLNKFYGRVLILLAKATPDRMDSSASLV